MLHPSEFAFLICVYSAPSILSVVVLQMLAVTFCQKRKVLSPRPVLRYLSTMLSGLLGGALLWKFIPALGPLFGDATGTGIPFFFPGAFLSALLVAIIGSAVVLRQK